MNTWLWRIILIVVAVALLPILIDGTTRLAVHWMNAITRETSTLFDPFSLSGDARVGGVIKLCLYLIAGTLLIRFFINRRQG